VRLHPRVKLFQTQELQRIKQSCYL
jgi:hypothetical protein